MLLDVCLGTRTAWKTLAVFSEAPGKAITRKEIKQLTKIGNKVLTRTLEILEKFSIITSEKIGKTNYYKPSLSNPFTEQIIELIKLETKQLNKLDLKTTNILRDFTYDLTNINLENIKQAILFGSYAKRTQTKTSDIDIAIVQKEKNPNDELMTTESIDKIEKRYGKQIQPHYATKLEGKMGLEIRKDGIKLMG